MNRRIAAVALVLQAAGVGSAPAQEPPPPEELLAAFISEGRSTEWHPATFFYRCPDLAEWQQAAFRVFAAAQLPQHREGQLAVEWGVALSKCDDPELERWYLERLERGMEDPSAAHQMVRVAITRSGSARIRDRLFDRVVDETVPIEYRVLVGHLWLGLLTHDNRLEQFRSAFSTGRLPGLVASGIINALIRQDLDGLIRETGQAVRESPDLAFRPGFELVVGAASREASPAARQRLASDILEAANRGALDAPRREHLTRTAQRLTGDPEPR